MAQRTMNVLVKYPTKSRPELFKSTFRKYRQDETASFLISIDQDDESMTNLDMLAWLDEQPRTTYRIGNSKSKVEAINDGVAETAWDLLILASDDMIPQRVDYAQRIADLFEEFFPEGDGVLHLNDGRTGRQLNTLPIMDRKYFRRFNYVYHPSFISVFCDNEFQEVSERLGRSIYVNEIIIHHAWTDITGADALHRRNESYYREDERIFRARQNAGFPV